MHTGSASNPWGRLGKTDRESEEHEIEEVSPAEDLIREHGVPKRVLLICEKPARRLDTNEKLAPQILLDSAGIIRSFIKDYREYDDLGEDIEEKDHQLFGEDGFEVMVDRVASIEKRLGLYDLSRFSPEV